MTNTDAKKMMNPRTPSEPQRYMAFYHRFRFEIFHRIASGGSPDEALRSLCEAAKILDLENANTNPCGDPATDLAYDRWLSNDSSKYPELRNV